MDDAIANRKAIEDWLKQQKQGKNGERESG
jgi:hypothetical protein